MIYWLSGTWPCSLLYSSRTDVIRISSKAQNHIIVYNNDHYIIYMIIVYYMTFFDYLLLKHPYVSRFFAKLNNLNIISMVLSVIVTNLNLRFCSN